MQKKPRVLPRGLLLCMKSRCRGVFFLQELQCTFAIFHFGEFSLLLFRKEVIDNTPCILFTDLEIAGNVLAGIRSVIGMFQAVVFANQHPHIFQGEWNFFLRGAHDGSCISLLDVTQVNQNFFGRRGEFFSLTRGSFFGLVVFCNRSLLFGNRCFRRSCRFCDRLLLFLLPQCDSCSLLTTFSSLTGQGISKFGNLSIQIIQVLGLLLNPRIYCNAGKIACQCSTDTAHVFQPYSDILRNRSSLSRISSSAMSGHDFVEIQFHVSFSLKFTKRLKNLQSFLHQFSLLLFFTKGFKIENYSYYYPYRNQNQQSKHQEVKVLREVELFPHSLALLF